MTKLELAPASCWNVIGVKGDRSCEKLAEVRHCHNCPVFERAARSFFDRPAPPGYAREMGDLLATNAGVGTIAQGVSLVLFEIGDQTLAIDTVAVVEVTEPRPIRRIAHRTNRVLLGLVNVHGQLELCASLQGLLHIRPREPAAKATPRMLLIERLGQRWVFAADEVIGVQRLDSARSVAVPATAQRDESFYVERLISWNERQVGQLDLERTFGALARSVA